jgi:hypothetical protein
MKNIKVITIIMLIALYTQVSHAQTATAKVPQSFKTTLNKMFNKYLDLKDALQKKDVTKANNEAKELLADANAVKSDSLSKEQLKEFNEHIGKVIMNSQHISEATNLPHQLEHFDDISDEMYALMKYFKTGGKTLYYDYCPMANGGDGAHWVSDKQDLKNPYMGGTIMGCEKQQDKF